jgi:hypothetical protein
MWSRNSIIRFGKVAVIVALAIGGLFALTQWLGRHTRVNIAGQVVDSTTGKPIGNARVIVTLVRNGFPYETYVGFGLVTDNDGTFALSTDSPKSFNHVFIEASTPDDRYAKVNARAKDHVNLRASFLPINKRNSPRLRYNRFRGLAGFGDGNELNFVKESW